MNPGTIAFFFYLIVSSFYVIIVNPIAKGPAFLFSYAIYIVVTILVSKIFKWKPILPLLFIELVGFCRIFYGLQVGMSRFSYLLLIMIGTVFVFLSQTKTFKTSFSSKRDSIDTSDSDGCSSCSSCSGCGGCGDD